MPRSLSSLQVDRIARLNDEEDLYRNVSKGNSGHDLGEVNVWRESIEEETDGNPCCIEHGAIEAGFGKGTAVVGNQY